ncbi:MAG: hypothetical protein ACRDHL_06360 [Candidatus Promineifilaceae bacterium]
MELKAVGITLQCLCGANMTAECEQMQFEDRGVARIGRGQVGCPRCGARYRQGERLRYRLRPNEYQLHLPVTFS